ncbi:MAG: ribonuclease Z [Gemmatimonadales bacterium]|nr:MAG: ribonuclease Z [Gemmatimonadales bacterium]
MIRVTLLGTAASRPTVGRNVSAVSIQREGESWLFDCGEGTQRQMMRFGTGFGISGIFVTHMHADHFLGIVGLLRTLALQGRTEPLLVAGPRGARSLLSETVHLGVTRVPFPVRIVEMEPGDAIPGDGFEIAAIEVEHGTPAVGYSLREFPRPGRFDVERARSLGVPEGPLFGRLHAGESVEVDGRTIRPQEVVGPERPGRKVVYTGDTAPVASVVAEAEGAQLLVHDATFGDDEVSRARDTFHTTARQAAEVGRRAGVERLVLTHLSARYAANPSPLQAQARRVFPGAVVGSDGLELEIGYPRDPSDNGAG